MKNTSINNSKLGKYYWWAQSAPVDVLTRKFRNQLPKIKDSFHMLRDSTPCCLFLSEIIKGKYDFGGILYNIPSDIFFPKMKKSDLRSSPLPNLSNNDIILHTTRPALNDDKEIDKRWLFKSGSILEKTILKNMECFFLYCNRQRIILSKEIKYEGSYRAIKFNLRIDAHIACKANVKDLLSLEGKWDRFIYHALFFDIKMNAYINSHAAAKNTKSYFFSYLRFFALLRGSKGLCLLVANLYTARSSSHSHFFKDC